MAPAIIAELMSSSFRKARRYLALFSFIILFSAGSFAQPTWVPGTPSVGTTGALTIPVNYGINMTGTVYIAVMNGIQPVGFYILHQMSYGFAQQPLGAGLACEHCCTHKCRKH